MRGISDTVSPSPGLRYVNEIGKSFLENKHSMMRVMTCYDMRVLRVVACHSYRLTL